MSRLLGLLAAANHLSLFSAAAVTIENPSAYPHIKRVEFEVAAVQGESYERKIEPMRMLDQTATYNSPVCSVEQVHITFGGNGPNSMTINWVNADLLSSNTVMFGDDVYMTESQTGTSMAYTQLLAPMSGNLVSPNLGAPGATAAKIIALADTSSFAYDKATGLQWANYKKVTTFATGQLGYSNPYAYYDSPMIHTVVLSDLTPGQPYYYKPVGGVGNCQKYYMFTNPPASGTKAMFPLKLALVADLGTTDVSAMSVAALKAMKAAAVIFTGDLSYADGWVPTWDVLGRMWEPVGSGVPMLSVGGNHELGSTENWQSYAARYPTNPEDSNSPNFCYYGREVGPVNVISLCSYGAANNGGLNVAGTSLQYQWLQTYLASIDRNRTPWIMVQFHVPIYCTNTGHYMEGEIFRKEYEPIMYQYGVDFVMNGHIHSYERSNPVYNNTVNPCGITHLVLGDAGNYENTYIPWIFPAKPWSAFREASFGVASLNFMSASQANYTWHRHACGQISTGASNNYGQNFSSSCVSQTKTGGVDNSANIMQNVDNYMMTKPSKALCPNRYMSKNPFSGMSVFSPVTVNPKDDMKSMKEMKSKEEVKAQRKSDEEMKLKEDAKTSLRRGASEVEVKAAPIEFAYPHIKRVEFEVAAVQGESYERKIEPMRMLDQTAMYNSPVCSVEQVHITFGGNGSNSMTINWVNAGLLSSNTVMFGDDATMMESQTGTSMAYTQLLAPMSGNLVKPNMGAPGATAAQIMALANTSSFAYDKATGMKWANYKLVKTFATGQMGYSNPYAYYDSPMIHTVVLTDLTPGQLYYYKPVGGVGAGCQKMYTFTNPPASGTAAMYPLKLALVADLGTTDVSAMSVNVLKAMNAAAVIFTGDLSYADGWVPTWDVLGRMWEPVGSGVPMLSVGGNHELGSTENWQSYAARYPTNPEDSNSPNFCYHGREVGPVNVISLCSYGAANNGGLNVNGTSLQYQWLQTYLASIDRNRTPWIMVQFHVPIYCTNTGHYMEGEIFRKEYEPLMYQYGVDIVMNGHIHSYERSNPVYNNTVNPCGITHLVLGDAGNYENTYIPWIFPAKPWSAFREASFGVASLNFMSASQANYTWHRHACGQISKGAANNYGQNFSSSCVSQTTLGGVDNSANIMQNVDNYLMTKPSKALCPNRYMSAVVYPPLPTAAPSAAPSMAAAAPISSPFSAASCFAGSESVTLESGELITISNVVVGDRVLTADASGKTLFSEVIYVPHGANTESTHFVHISTENKDLKMTRNHILPSGLCGSTLPLVHASSVSVGDCVQTVSGQEKVTSIQIVKGEGVYTVVTNEEYVVVNGIIASSFGANHMMANLFYNIHRFMYAMYPSLLTSSLLHSANEGLGMMIPFFGPSNKL